MISISDLSDTTSLKPSLKVIVDMYRNLERNTNHSVNLGDSDTVRSFTAQVSQARRG